MTKTPVEIYREKVEEFGRLAKSVKARIEQQKTPNEEGANKALKILTNELNSLTLAILNAELERVEEERKYEFNEHTCNECGGLGYIVQSSHCCGGVEKTCRVICPVPEQIQCPCGDGIIGFPNEENTGYNKALTDHADYIKSQIKAIEEL